MLLSTVFLIVTIHLHIFSNNKNYVMATKTATKAVVSSVQRLSDGVAPWKTADPFLFCVFHKDAFPPGNEAMAPEPKELRGRNIGNDFDGKDGWRMYHGDVHPGFPRHPHRGFETITIVTDGYIDHSDSLGAIGRIGPGDVQWMTAGAGIVHSEMFPLINRSAPNPTDFFQLWLNLPKASKKAKPHFTMFWNEDVPRVPVVDPATGAKAEVRIVAGSYQGVQAPNPPPESFASDPAGSIQIFILTMEAGSSLVLPAVTEASSGSITRTLYFFEGANLQVGETTLPHLSIVTLDEKQDCRVTAKAAARCLYLQGRNIMEPVAQHGPFVMNTQQEIREAFEDYRKTEFGGWPHREDGPLLPRDHGRGATLPDGTVERPPIAKRSSEL
jgi:redox-sensitive bicupin YhaK (pirin superfamily)